VDNSLILQLSPHVQAPPGRIRGILEWAVIILINAPDRIRTRDLWLWYHIELHAPTSSTQKVNLIGKGGQFTYTPTPFVLFFVFLFPSYRFLFSFIVHSFTTGPPPTSSAGPLPHLPLSSSLCPPASQLRRPHTLLHTERHSRGRKQCV
jgi:hypothetical protein